jgi:guanylate kinase
MSIVFTISEVFGSGQSSVVNAACKLLDGLDLAIPYTTRPPRIADNQDSGFVFTSREVFEQMIAGEEFLEHVSIFGNYYGTPARCLRQARENGKDLLVKVDGRGFAQIKQKIPDAVSILVVPGQSSKGPHAFHPKMPNPDEYDHVIVNDRPEDSTNRLIEIIRSERLRRS